MKGRRWTIFPGDAPTLTQNWVRISCLPRTDSVAHADRKLDTRAGVRPLVSLPITLDLRRDCAGCKRPMEGLGSSDEVTAGMPGCHTSSRDTTRDDMNARAEITSTSSYTYLVMQFKTMISEINE